MKSSKRIIKGVALIPDSFTSGIWDFCYFFLPLSAAIWGMDVRIGDYLENIKAEISEDRKITFEEQNKSFS